MALNIRHHETVAYRLQQDSLAEHTNQDFGGILASSTFRKQDDWEAYVLRISFAMNSAVHKPLVSPLFF